MWSEEDILRVLDDCGRRFTFPTLDNGYVYLAATRLSVHRSEHDWAIVIEVFGFSPRTGIPDLHVSTFASTLRDRDPPSRYVAHESYLRTNPHNEARFFCPIDEGDWQAADNAELVACNASELVLRGDRVRLPARAEYPACGVALEDEREIQVYELIRVLAAHHRDEVLATPAERWVSVPEHLEEVLVLEDWQHPDLADDEHASASPTFREIAARFSSGDFEGYCDGGTGNTHGRHRPEGGTL